MAHLRSGGEVASERGVPFALTGRPSGAGLPPTGWKDCGHYSGAKTLLITISNILGEFKKGWIRRQFFLKKTRRQIGGRWLDSEHAFRDPLLLRIGDCAFPSIQKRPSKEDHTDNKRPSNKSR